MSQPLERAKTPAKGSMELIEIGFTRDKAKGHLSVRQVHKERTLLVRQAVKLIRNSDFESLMCINHERIFFRADQSSIVAVLGQ